MFVFVVYVYFHVDVVGQISEAELSPELQPLPSNNILMVEVENIQHEQFTVTEEVKVQTLTLRVMNSRRWRDGTFHQ